MWNPTDIAFVAGLLEGEGCFHVGEYWVKDKKTKEKKFGPYFKQQIHFGSTDEETVRRFVSLVKVPCSIYVTRRSERKYRGMVQKDFWTARIQERSAIYALCAAIYPWMSTRRKEAIVKLMYSCIPVDLQKNNISGYRGVSWNSKKGKWRAGFNGSDKYVHLGYFDLPKEAAKVVKEYRNREVA